jgi:transcriptional regulator with XRE-family HTH domain
LPSPAEQFRRLRIERGWQIDELAKRAGIPTERIREIESGSTEAWFEEAVYLAKAYGIPIEEVAGRVFGRRGR